MQTELSVAVNYVVSHLYNKLPRRRVDMFSEELINNLTSKFDGHWYPDTPAKGSAFRCTKVTGSNGVNLDPVFEEAAKASGLVVREVIDLLPHELTMWIDPGEVSYRIGERGHVVVLLSRKQHSSLASHWLPDFDSLPMGSQNGDYDPFSATNSCVDSSLTFFDPVALLASLGLSDTSPPTNSWPSSPSLASYSSPVNFQAPPFATPQPQRNQSQTFTAAMFAQTKFGSTKLRTPQQPKRPSQLSPSTTARHNKSTSSSSNGSSFDIVRANQKAASASASAAATASAVDGNNSNNNLLRVIQSPLTQQRSSSSNHDNSCSDRVHSPTATARSSRSWNSVSPDVTAERVVTSPVGRPDVTVHGGRGVEGAGPVLRDILLEINIRCQSLAAKTVFTEHDTVADLNFLAHQSR